MTADAPRKHLVPDHEDDAHDRRRPCSCRPFIYRHEDEETGTLEFVEVRHNSFHDLPLT
jgi:hypothetical protein